MEALYTGSNQTFSPKLTEGENQFLQHNSRWGSAGWPIQKVKGGWIWTEFFGVKGAPTVYKTKKAAGEAIERYIEVLLDKLAGRV